MIIKTVNEPCVIELKMGMQLRAAAAAVKGKPQTARAVPQFADRVSELCIVSSVGCSPPVHTRSAADRKCLYVNLLLSSERLTFEIVYLDFNLNFNL